MVVTIEMLIGEREISTTMPTIERPVTIVDVSFGIENVCRIWSRSVHVLS